MVKQEKLHFAVIASDVALFRLVDGQLEVLLIPVDSPHYKGLLGLPGGLILPEETATESVLRHLQNKGGIKRAFLEQLYTFSDCNRDLRGRVLSVAYLGLVSEEASAIEDVAAKWYPVKEVKKLAYDHNEILLTAIGRLKSKLGYTTIVRHLLPKKFTFNELQSAYESILGTTLDKRNFRKKIFSLNLLKDTDEVRKGESHRPASVYTWANNSEKIGTII